MAHGALRTTLTSEYHRINQQLRVACPPAYKYVCELITRLKVEPSCLPPPPKVLTGATRGGALVSVTVVWCVMMRVVPVRANATPQHTHSHTHTHKRTNQTVHEPCSCHPNSQLYTHSCGMHGCLSHAYRTPHQKRHFSYATTPRPRATQPAAASLMKCGAEKAHQ